MTFPYPHFMPDVAQPATVAKVLDATSTDSGTITYPTGIQSGDMIFLWHGAQDDFVTPTDVTPSGFTNITNQSGSVTRFRVDRKFAAGGESGTLNVITADAWSEARMVVFRRTPAGTQGNTAGSIQAQLTTGNPSAQAQDGSAQTPPLVVLGFYMSSGTVSPRTFSPAEDGEFGSGQAYIKWKIYNEGATIVSHSIDMDDEGTVNFLASLYNTYTP